MWPIQFAAFVIPTVPKNYWSYLLAAMFGPLQGFFWMHWSSSLEIGNRFKNGLSQSMKKLMSRISTMFANTETSQSIRKLLARRSTRSTNNGTFFQWNGRHRISGRQRSKQTFERSVDCKEAVQLDISVGRIERLGEEGNIPEAALDGKGNESDESSD